MSTDIIAQQKKYLDKLQAISKRPVLIKMKEGATPEGADPDEYRWVPYMERWQKVITPIYTRTILANEICFDPDVKEWHVLKEELQKVYEYCKANSIPIQYAYTGGNGIHGHLFLNGFELNQDDIKKAEKFDIDLPKIIRDTILNLIMKGAGASRQRLKIDSGKVTFDKGSKGSMIREFGTTRPDGGFKTLITSIPDTREEARKLPIVFPDTIERWTPPGNYIEEIEKAIADAIDRAEKFNDYNLENISLQGNEIEAFPCIKKLLKNGAESRYYGAVSITLLSRRCGVPWPATEDYIKKFFSKCDITEDEAKLRIHNVKTLESSAHNFSCRKIKEHFGEDICSFYKCVLCNKIKKLKAEAVAKSKDVETSEHIKKMANELMAAEKHLKFFRDTYQTIHAGDVPLGESLIISIGDQSVLNSDGIHPKVSGRFGGGKTHGCKAMAHLVPQKYVLKSSLSDKAIYYADILPGMIIFSDDVDLSEGLEGVIKRSSSSFQEGDTHTTVDKDREIQTLTIPPRVAWWLTSVDDNQSQQLLSRQFGGGVDESEEHDQKVTEFQLKQGYDGAVGLPMNDDVLVCREIFSQIKQHLLIVRIPFSEKIEWQDKSNHRNLAIFMDIIKSYAMLNFKTRVMFEGALVASTEDYKAAKELYDKKAETQTTKYNESELKVLRWIKENQHKDSDLCVTNADIQTALKLSRQRVQQLLHGRKDKPDSGLLAKEPSLHFEKVSIKIGDTITSKNQYSLDKNFSLLASYETMVDLKPEVVEHCKHCYTLMYH